MSILKRLIPKSSTLTTYQIGLLVARTHRILKEYTDNALVIHNITSVDWAILGLLHDTTPSGLRLSDLSHSLGVEAPFISVRIERLKKRDLVNVVKNAQDKRERFAVITPTGRQLVITVEPTLRVTSRTWLKGVTAIQVLGFIRVMQQVVRNNDQN